MESNNFQYEGEMKWENAGAGVVRQIMAYNDDLMMVKVKSYVASGVFEFTTDGETKIVHPGDGIYMKPGVLHGCRCLEAGVLIDTFSPIRKDFL